MTKRGRKADPLTPPINGVSPHMSAIAVTDENSYVVYWSSQAEVLLGYASAEMIGKPVADLCASGGTLRHRDGRLLDAQVRLSPLLNAEGEAAFLLTMLRGSDARALADSALMGWIFDQQPVVLAICDREGRMLRGNKVMQQAIGKSEDAVRGLRPTEFLTGPAFEDAERLILRVSETGEPEIREYFVRSPGEDKAHAWAIDAFPLKDAAGRVHAVGYMANDYSQQYGSRERLALLSEARTRIGTSLDIVRTAHEFTEVAVPRFADFVSVDLLKPVFQGELPSPVHPGHDILHRAASSSGFEHPLIAALPGPGDVHTPMPSSPVAMCLANGKAALYDAEDPQIVRWLAEDPLRAALVDVFGARSLIAIPIRAQGTVLGAALFVRTASREAFSPDDLTVTEDLVARAAICLDNCRRFTRERGISLALQRSLLPQGPMSHPAVEAAVRYVPAGGSTEAGGDWFDVIPLPGARVGLVIGDVVGHGVNASATMGRLRTAVRTLADIDLPPDELLTHLDDIVTHNESERSAGDATSEIPGDIGATCVYAVYDPVSGICSLARAGHPAPVLVRPDGTSTIIDLPPGPPLGLGSLPFEATELTLPEGSLLALFTDGLLGARVQDVDQGLSELRRTLAQPAPSLDALADSVLFGCPDPGADDVALLLARTRVFDRSQVVSWDLPNDFAVVSQARERACDRLAAWGLEEELFITELVVSELVTNAIRYGQPPIELRLIRDRSLICEVSDGSSTSPHLRRARVFDEGGRGLLLVAQLTERWGTHYTPTGKTIWAEQLLSPR